jgi:hypothetical protein
MQSGLAILAKDRIWLQICSMRLTMTSCSKSRQCSVMRPLFTFQGMSTDTTLGYGATNIHTPLLNMSVIVRKLMFGVGLHMIE